MKWLAWARLKKVERSFSGKVVAITGAGSGIGRALAIKFAYEGAQLALSDIDMAALEGTAKALPQGTISYLYSVDVSKPEAVFKFAEDVRRDFGVAHVVINNAGALIAGKVANTSLEEYRWQLEINLYGVLYGTKAFLPTFLAQREGLIVNVSSLFGLFAFPAHSAYSMSKFAVRGLTECLWSELAGTGVDAVCVHPGSVKTGIDKAGRLAKLAGPEEQKLVNKLNKRLTFSVEECADEIYAGLVKGNRRILTGKGASAAHWMSRLLPDSYPSLLRWIE